jgi:hypothetical protein
MKANAPIRPPGQVLDFKGWKLDDEERLELD